MECVGDAGKFIFAAARDGDTVTVGKILSTAGAQSLINYQEETSGATALHCAAQNGHEFVTEQLIEARCNMDLQQKDGSTPLHIAAGKGKDAVTKQLVGARCSVDLRDNCKSIYTTCCCS